MNPTKQQIHNKRAPYWAAAMLLFCVLGVSTTYVKGGSFWHGYVLDIMGPAWNYILFRGLGSRYKLNMWRVLFTPKRVFRFFLLVCLSIEMAQYFELYPSTFDPFDLFAYVALLIPLYVLDLRQQRRMS